LSQERFDLPFQVDQVLFQALHHHSQQRFPDVLSFANTFQQALDRSHSPGLFSTLPSQQILPVRPSNVLPNHIDLSSSGKPLSPPIGIEVLSSLPGHTSLPRYLQWDSRGGYLASVGTGQRLHIWSVNKQIGVPVSVLTHKGNVSACCWSPESIFLAAATHDGTIHLWENCTSPFSSPRLKTVWWGHDGKIPALAWSPDGTMIISGGSDRLLRVWDINGNALASLSMHGRGGVTVVAWSFDGRILASGGADHRIILWDILKKKPLHICEAHQDRIQQLAWSPDGLLLASASGKKDTRICFWNAQTGHCLAAWRGHTGDIVGLCWSPDASWIATAATDNTLCLWDARTTPGQQIGHFSLEEGLSVMAGGPASHLIAMGRINMTIQILRLTKN
jgi:WD40 repeat protein